MKPSEVQLVREPRVTLIGAPTFFEPAHLPVKWLDPGTDGERLAEFAGRLCYMSQSNPADRTTAAYLDNILKQGHGSVLEHAVFVVLVEGISRTCSHELVRHRAGFGYSQVSQRYVDSSDLAFVIPPAYLEDYPYQDELRHEAATAVNRYETLVERGMAKGEARKQAREAARSALPNSAETKIVVSANVRAWRTMLELRCGLGADREIRRLALTVLDVLRAASPRFFHDFSQQRSEKGEWYAVVDHHKV